MKTEDMIEVLERLKGVPAPKADETQDEFYSRCMGDEDMNGEYPDEAQRSAMCTARWTGENDPKGASDGKTPSKDINWNRINASAASRSVVSVDSRMVDRVVGVTVPLLVTGVLARIGAEAANAAVNRLSGRLD